MCAVIFNTTSGGTIRPFACCFCLLLLLLLVLTSREWFPTNGIVPRAGLGLAEWVVGV